MSAHVLLNLINKLRKSDKMRSLPSILSLFHNGLQSKDWLTVTSFGWRLLSN